jgi:zinc protease
MASLAFLVAFVAMAQPAAATKIERVVSPGGIEAWLVHEPSIPLVALNFAFLGGASEDPAVKPGVGNMTASLLDDGAGELDAKAFHEQIERVRAQILAGLRRDSTNPNRIASRTWWKTAFPGHPYGQPNNGTFESVPTIAAEDLRSYARRVLTRANLKVAAVGDIDAATLGRTLDRVFGSLPANGNLGAVPDAAPTAAGRRLVVQLDVPQSVVQLGGVGLMRNDRDFIPAYVVNHILGGGSFTSRLYDEVREKRGLAYGVYSYLQTLKHSALFMVGTQANADRTGEALALIEAQIRHMVDEGPTEEELAKAKAYLKGSYALNFDTSTKIANVLLNIQLDNLGIDYIDKRNGLIDAVTIDDARRAAKRLAAGGMFVTVVGRPKGLASKEPGG